MSSIILGIDPGLAITGFGILESHSRDTQKVLGYGVIRTSSQTPLPERLMEIRQGLVELINTYKPNAVSVEKLYFGKNAKTAMSVGHARGVVIMTLAEKGIIIYEYTPLQIKMALTGYGRADKKQIQQLVQQLLHLKEMPKPDDAADGLAVALTAIVSEEFTSIK